MRADTLGLVLAGGLARRLGGGDKGLRLVGGRTVLGRALERLRPQVGRIVLNANGDPARFAAFGVPVVADSLPGYPGPLAGLLAGLDWAAEHAPACGWVITVPGDAPFLPADLVERLHAVRGDRARVCAASGGRRHPVVALVPIGARAELRAALEGGLRKVGGFFEAAGVAAWASEPIDPFFNVNTDADLAAADRLALTL